MYSDVWRSRRSAHEEPRSGSNNSEHESTSGHPTNFGSGRLIRVFRDIGRILSLLLPSRPPVAHWSPAEKERSKPKTECGFVEGKKRFQLCFVPPVGVSFAKTRTPPVRSEVTPRAGSREPSCTGLGRLLEGSTWETYWHAKRFLTACTARQAHKAFALESAGSPLPRFSVLRSQARRWRPS